MYTMSLENAYNFFVENGGMPDYMKFCEYINLVPLPQIEYINKIRGAMVSIAIGDAFGSYLDVRHIREIDYINDVLKGEKRSISLSITDDTELSILFAESLIINQGFQPEDLANRFIRYPITAMGKTMKEFIINYHDRRVEWYKSGIESAGNGAVIRCAPAALINYGDFTSLKLMAGMQAAITHMDQMAIASSILQATAIAYLTNLPPFTIKDKKDILNLIDLCGKSIKGIETKVYRTRKSNEIVNLYSRIIRDLKEAIEEDIDIKQLQEEWGSGSYVLESLPLALYIFCRNPNDYEKILKDCLMTEDAETITSIALTLAGAYIGYNNIPKGYVNKIRNLEELLTLSDRLFELSLKNKQNNPYRRMRETISEEKNQDEIHQLLWKGINYNKDEDYRNAVKYFEDLISKSPDLKKNEKIKLHIIEAYEGLGTIQLEKEDYEGALKSFKKALAYDLNHPIILCDLAVTYLNLDDLDKAEKYARRSVEIAPEYQIGREVLEAIKSLKKKN
ncbi:ADP-ribosylglycohydrolase family protein [Alkaliphilus transvaalensis]|uniref:ADP-ribosylglycohydrolase family protein n=1 Tax=Alkaliphilus transvaalensis TaxID=114628 RepID=UPI00047C90B7|nr:ADP-ribosylglycohydrolase family protein [Alkaliphilus transvaalensis]